MAWTLSLRAEDVTNNEPWTLFVWEINEMERLENLGHPMIIHPITPPWELLELIKTNLYKYDKAFPTLKDKDFV